MVFEERPRDFPSQTKERSHGFNRVRDSLLPNIRLLIILISVIISAKEVLGPRSAYRRVQTSLERLSRRKHPNMKITEYICCVLACICLLKLANSEISRDKNPFLQFERQLLDTLTTEKTIKSKRPFCNAFTGCGRKRSFYANTPTLQGSQDFQVNGNVRFPVSLYKALLNAAKQNTRNTIDREEYDRQLLKMPQVYLSGQIPLQDTVES